MSLVYVIDGSDGHLGMYMDNVYGNSDDTLISFPGVQLLRVQSVPN